MMENAPIEAETSSSVSATASTADVENSMAITPEASPATALDLLGKCDKPNPIAFHTPSASTVDDTVMMTGSDDASCDEECSSDEGQEPEEANPSKKEQRSARLHYCCNSVVVRRWVDLMDELRNCITRAVLCITNHAARNPYSYVIGISLLSFGLLGTGFATNFDMTVVADESYTGKNSIIREQKEWVDHISGFPSPPLSIRMMIHAQGASVLTQEGVRHAFQVVQDVHTTPEYDAVCSDELSQKHYNKRHRAYVGGYSSTCNIRGVTMLWNNSQTVMEGEVLSDADVQLAVAAKKFPDGSDMDSREIMSRPTHRNGVIVGAESLLMEFMIPSDHTKSADLETAVLERLLQLREDWSDHSSQFDLEIFTYSSLEKETTRAVMKDLPLIAVVFVIMALFTCAVFSSKTGSTGDGKSNYSSSSHMLLGLGAVVCIVLSLATSYGILYIIGMSSVTSSRVAAVIVYSCLTYFCFPQTHNEQEYPSHPLHRSCLL